MVANSHNPVLAHRQEKPGSNYQTRTPTRKIHCWFVLTSLTFSAAIVVAFGRFASKPGLHTHNLGSLVRARLYFCVSVASAIRCKLKARGHVCYAALPI
jgi:hypothetical protein